MGLAAARLLHELGANVYTIFRRNGRHSSLDFPAAGELLEKALSKIADNGSANIIASTGGFGCQDAFADCAAVVNAPSYEATLDWYAAHPDVIQNGYVFSKQCLCAYVKI